MNLPDESTPFIVAQRTHYLSGNPAFMALTLLGGVGVFYKASIALKARLFSRRIQEEYAKELEEEFSALSPYLPQTASAVIDIGCGIAGIDVLIAARYPQASLFLLDRTKTDQKIYYGMNERGAFYNSLDISRKVLEMNGVAPGRIHTQEATGRNEVMFEEAFDVVLSLLSWGFHYPVSSYLAAVYEKLKPAGVLILDIRKGSGGEKEIERRFGSYEVISERAASLRIVARKPHNP